MPWNLGKVTIRRCRERNRRKLPGGLRMILIDVRKINRIKVNLLGEEPRAIGNWGT